MGRRKNRPRLLINGTTRRQSRMSKSNPTRNELSRPVDGSGCVMEAGDREILGLMVDVAIRAADRAIQSWLAGDYLPDPKRIREHVAYWQDIKRRVGDLGRRLRE